MPHLLNITNGTTTLPLSTTNCLLRYYVPQTPQFNQAGRFDPVGESIEIMLYGASTSAVQAALNAIEAMFLAARNRQNSGVGAKVYLQFQPIGDATLWRSEVLAGEVHLGRGAMTAYGQAKLPVQLTLDRVPFWEGARAAIPLANGNGSGNTAGLTVWNHDDGGTGHDNWVDIAGAAVGGVLPSPLEVQMRNTSGASRGYRNFYVANNAFSTGIAHILEAENRTGGYGTVQSSADYSNGQYLRLTGSTIICTWDLPAALLQATAGRYMRLLARFAGYTTPTPAIYARAQIRDYYGLVTLAESPYETVLSVDEDYICDLGVLPLPPGGYSASWAKHTLVLTFRASSSVNVELDFLQLTPADEFCYRHVQQRGMVVVNNDWIVDDGIEGLAYLIEGGANHPIYTMHTAPVHVLPGVNQRLYVLQDGDGTLATWTMSLKVFYRPRRLTI